MSNPVGAGRPRSREGYVSELILALRDIRIEQSRAILDIATEMDTPASSIGCWERGEREPTILSVERWAKALGYELDLHRIEDDRK